MLECVSMPKNLQIKNVPDDVHAQIRQRAAEDGVTISDYLLRVAENATKRPTIEEMVRRLQERGPIEVSIEPVDIIRADRDSR